MKKIIILFLLLGVKAFSQPINDNPCNAIPLSVSATCNQTTGQFNSGATASAGVPAPGCGSYVNGDIWFSAVCPASGNFTVTSYYAGLNNLGMAAYVGSCSSLTLSTCKYSGIGAGNNPILTITAGTPGTTYYIRVWSPAFTATASVNGFFDICATATSTAQLVPNNADCLNAIPVCQSSFTTTTAYSGTGNVGNEINTSSTCLGSGEKNDVWYQFTVQNAGQLCFGIDPINNADDYDWVLYNITGLNCSDLYNNATADVACNFISNGGGSWTTTASDPSWVLSSSFTQGLTGLFPTTPQSGYPQNSPCIAVSAGQDFVLNISNYSASASGFHLYFPPPGTAGMAIIYDNIPPTMQAPQSYPSCGGSQLFATFSENIKCNTVSAADFTLNGPGGPYTISSQIGSACSGGAPYENSFLIGFSPALNTTGVYTLCLNASAAASVLDACNNPAATTCYTFAITVPSITATPANTSCSGVSATGSISATGSGSAAFTYQLNGGTSQASGNFTGLTAGTYTVSTIGTTGCSASTVVTVSSPPALSITAVPSAASCSGAGSIVATVSGGTPGYTYTWSPSGGNAATGVFATAGTYSVSVLDSKNCPISASATTSINPFPSATLSFTNPNCGASNGVVVINNTSSVGQTISSFASSLGTVTGQTVTGLAASTPVITLTNNFGCTFTVSATLTNAAGPSAIATTTTSSTCGLNNGSFTFGTPTGGTPTYSYSINGGAFSATSPTTGLAAGNYSVTVKDANGCLFTKPLVISNIAGPTAIAGTSGPASCAGPTGTYTVTGVTGGTSTYSYSIDGGAFAATSVITGLTSGTHSITVKDANGCTFPSTFSVGLLAGITSASVNASTASCGVANGTSTVSSVTGGVPTYSYSFDGGGFTSSVSTSGLAAGNHTVIVKDANTCTLTVPYTVVSLGSPTTSITSFSNVTCFGLSNGSCTVAIPTGGAGAPFTYTLTSPFQSNGTGQFSGLAAGVYNITVKDVGGCVATTSITITQPSSVAVTATAVPAKCFGAATGTINVSGSGGTPTYSYNLNGGAYQASSTFANQFAAVYTMGVKDINGCLSTQTVQVTQPTALAILVSTQNANCTAANGIATTTVSGGTPIYTYTWTGGGGAAAISNSVVAGTYSVTASDANGCSITSAAVIGLTPGGTASITAINNVTCNGANNGKLTCSPIGGAGPYSYSWTPGGQTVATAINLSPGTYSCTVTDFYGCKATAVGTITQPPVLTAIMNSNNVKCFGGSTGTVTAAGSGGTGPYTYLWTTIPSTLSSVNNVAIGNYPCNITDANGCTITQSITVTQPTAISLTSSVTTANCGQSNGSATVTASGGAPGAYTYSWSAGSITAIQSGIAANTYTILVQDANNCQKTLAVTVPNASGPVISIASQTNVSCFGGTNGAVITSVSGGVGTYTYSWSNGFTTPIATNLSANLYTVSATDGAGCVTSTSVVITQPTALTVSILPTNPKCFGATNGSAIAAAAGGTPSYTYAWTSGGGSNATTNQIGAGNYGLTVTDANGCVTTSSMALINPPAMSANITSTNVTCFGTCNGIATATNTNGIGVVSYFWTGGSSPISSQTASGLCAGSYTVLATDQNSCTASAQITITQPTAITANISSTGSVTCNGGNNGFAVVTASGGTGAYSYAWLPSGGSSPTASSLTAGLYTVTVKDANLCSVNTTTTIIQPSPLATTLTPTNPKCNGVCDGTANIAFAGGAGSTTFLWQPGLQSGNFVNNLCAGSQTVTITSNGACPTILTFTLTEPAALTAVGSASNSNCGQNNGKTCANVGGGTLPYNNLWSNGVSTLCNNNIVAGAYSFTVTDGNGCKAFASGLVNDIAGPVVAVISQTNVSCFNGNNGAATTTITGGVPTYSISWNSGQLTQNVTNFTSGIKNITVIDAAGCIGTASVNITQPTQLVSAVGSSTNVLCFGQSNGGATMLVNGGTTPYTYVWTPSAQTSSILINVPASAYTGSVTDANGCVTSSSITISQPQALIMTASSFSNISCFGGNDGQISTTVQGGTLPSYIYSWTPSQINSGLLTGLTAGGYSLAVTDGNGCSINANFTITEPSVLTSSYTSQPATCGLTNGSASLTVGGGTPVYHIVWNTPGTPIGLTVSNMAAGNGWLANITDAKGCRLTQTVGIANPPMPAITGSIVTPPSCFGFTNGSITINYTPGTAPYTVSWPSPISQTITSSALAQNVVGVAGGVYTATLTDFYGCKVSQAINVVAPSPLVLLVSPDVTMCFGQTTQLTAFGQSGTPGYTYTWTPNPFVGSGPHTVSPTSTTVYNVSVSDVNGCSPSPKVITVNVTPPLIANGFSLTKCDGDAAMLTPNISSPGKGSSYDFSWSTGASYSQVASSSVSVTANYATAPNTYSVIIDDGCTMPKATAVFTVNANPLPIISFTANPLQGCAPLSVTLTGTSNGASDVFTWSGDKGASIGTGNPYTNLTLSDSGKYSITLSVFNPLTQCSNMLTKTNYIEVYPRPIASFYPDPRTTSILDPNFNFINTSHGATGYYWDFGDPTAINGTNNSIVKNPSHGYGFTGTYLVHLVATSIKGCKDTARTMVEVTPDFALYIPNTFTPDGNGLNDVFQPLGVGIDEENYRMDIFDRWGENIFTSNNFRKGWDGTVKGGSKLAEQGVYTYKIMARDILGNKHPMIGHVTVIRKEN